MINWPDYIKERTAQLRNLRSGAPDVMKAFSGLAQAALAPISRRLARFSRAG